MDCGVPVIELTQGAGSVEGYQIELAGKVRGFAAHSGLQSSQKIVLVEPICGLLQSLHAGGWVDIRTDGDDPFERGQCGP